MVMVLTAMATVLRNVGACSLYFYYTYHFCLRREFRVEAGIALVDVLPAC